MNIEPVSFTVNVVGDTTGTEYVGLFKVKPVLNTTEQIARDAVMRDIIGPNPQEASPRAKSQAYILAEIRIRAIEAPAFWTGARDGGGLFDENVMGAVYDKIQDVEKQWRADVKKKADEAREALKKLDPLYSK